MFGTRVALLTAALSVVLKNSKILLFLNLNFLKCTIMFIVIQKARQKVLHLNILTPTQLVPFQLHKVYEILIVLLKQEATET